VHELKKTCRQLLLVSETGPDARGCGGGGGGGRPPTGLHVGWPLGGEEAKPGPLVPPSDGGAPRLVAVPGTVPALSVWDTGTGAFLGALQGPDDSVVCSLVTYQRPSDGRPRVAAGSDGGHLCIWDGDDFQLLHTIRANPEGLAVGNLAVYEEPTSGRTRLVTG
jgi:hypothetical protein